MNFSLIFYNLSHARFAIAFIESWCIYTSETMYSNCLMFVNYKKSNWNIFFSESAILSEHHLRKQSVIKWNCWTEHWTSDPWCGSLYASDITIFYDACLLKKFMPIQRNVWSFAFAH